MIEDHERQESPSDALRRHDSTSQRKFDNENSRRVNSETIDRYRQFFSNLFQETQLFDVDEIIAAFAKAQREGGKINQEVVETNKEIETIEQEIAAERKKMSSFKQLTPEELTKLNEVAGLEAEIRKNEETIKSYDRKMNAISRNLVSFKVSSTLAGRLAAYLRRFGGGSGRPKARRAWRSADKRCQPALPARAARQGRREGQRTLRDQQAHRAQRVGKRTQRAVSRRSQSRGGEQDVPRWSGWTGRKK